jgi:hypothetical protein
MESALISAIVTIIGLAIGFVQWRRDVQIKLGQIRESVSVELIQQRIEPYTEFWKRLEAGSSIHLEEYEKNPQQKAQEIFNILQDAVYGKVGLLASHETRLVLLYLRSICRDIITGNQQIPFSDFRLKLWALHVALRSDLGIQQPMWKDVIEKIREFSDDRKNVEDLINSPSWETIYRKTY